MNAKINLSIQLLFKVIVGLQIVSVLTSFKGVQSSECPSSRLVRYKLVFQTYWNRKLFPRQYPEWRPPAQWSKVVGGLFHKYFGVLSII